MATGKRAAGQLPAEAPCLLLGDDLLLAVCRHLPVCSRHRLAPVCKRFDTLLKSDAAAPVWRTYKLNPWPLDRPRRPSPGDIHAMLCWFQAHRDHVRELTICIRDAAFLEATSTLLFLLQQSLEVLELHRSLAFCKVQLLAPLSSMTQLRTLHVRLGSLHVPPLPAASLPQLARGAKLEHLAWNVASTALPAQLGAATALTNLTVSWSPGRSSLPEGLSRLLQLRELSLNFSQRLLPLMPAGRWRRCQRCADSRSALRA